MQWEVHSKEPLYQDEWIDVQLADVELPDGATYIGPPADSFESERVEWVPLNDIKQLIDKRQIVAGSTLVPLALRLGRPLAATCTRERAQSHHR